MRNQELHVVHDPEPDERSEEEAMLVETIRQAIPFPIIGAVIRCSPPGTPERVVMIAVAIAPWRIRQFKTLQSQLDDLLRTKIQADAQGHVVRMPWRLTWTMFWLQIAESAKRKREREQRAAA